MQKATIGGFCLQISCITRQIEGWWALYLLVVTMFKVVAMHRAAMF